MCVNKGCALGTTDGEGIPLTKTSKSDETSSKSECTLFRLCASAKLGNSLLVCTKGNRRVRRKKKEKKKKKRKKRRRKKRTSLIKFLTSTCRLRAPLRVWAGSKSFWMKLLNWLQKRPSSLFPEVTSTRIGRAKATWAKIDIEYDFDPVTSIGNAVLVAK